MSYELYELLQVNLSMINFLSGKSPCLLDFDFQDSSNKVGEQYVFPLHFTIDLVMMLPQTLNMAMRNTIVTRR